MAKPWSDVAQSPAFQALPYDQQEAARQQYFSQVVQPQVPPEQLQGAKSQFDSQTFQGPPETAGRIAGLAARAGLKGIGEVADIPKNVAGLAFAGADWARQKARSALGLPTEAPQANPAAGGAGATGAMDQVATGLGAPSPATGGERIASAAVAGAPTALIAPGSAISGALSGMAGGAASQTAAEAGGSKFTQVLAALAGGGLPLAGASLAAGARGAVRGADGAPMAASAAAVPGQTVGMASGNGVIQALEANLARIPGGGAIRNAVSNLNTKISDQSADIVDNLRGAADAEPATAGAMLTGQLNKAADRIDAARGKPFDAIDAQIPQGAVVPAQKLVSTLDRLTQVTPGGEHLGGMLVDPKLKAMRDALQKDIDANGGEDMLPIQVLRDWKTRLGGQINWTGFGSSDPINGALKQVWGSLKDDIMDGAQRINPKLGPQIQAANSQYAVAQAQLENLRSVVDKAGGPEKVFTSLISGTKDGGTQLQQALSQVDPAGRQLLAATQLQRMGLANAGQQGATGGAFSADTFLTNWNKMHPDARSALFGQLPNNYAQNVTKLAHDAEILKRFSKVMPNSSNTAAALTGASQLTAGILAAVTWHPGGVAAIGSAYGAARVMSSVLTSPKTVAWLVKPSDFKAAAKAGAPAAIAGANAAAASGGTSQTGQP